MPEYTIKFEIFGKRMKYDLIAENEYQAREKIKDKIIFHKIEKHDKDFFNELLNMIKK
jgi:hypothetical protein